jgi:hypothetical protein
MLSKEICEKCWRAYFREHFTDPGEMATVAAWEGLDEIDWAKGFVHCCNFEEDPRYNGSKYDDRYPITLIPVCCRRKLEHAIAAGRKNNAR